jgi:hypothetical protein
MNRLTRTIAALVAVPTLAALAGCSISVSSWSLSKSVRSSSRSSDSSSSSSPGAAEEAYREDVSDYTRAYVKSSTAVDLRAFQAELARLAEQHGITNWEENGSTYTAIGDGLARAGASEAALRAYKQNLSGGDPTKAQLIQRGYDAAR